MTEFIKYPSIEQYRNVVKEVKRLTGNEEKLPKLTFTGTVKIHGTNAGICYNSDTGEIWAQSRNNVLTVDQDNAGFAKYVESNIPTLLETFNLYADRYSLTGIISLFGEWCGQGIQKGVGITELEKMFILFGVKSNDQWFDVVESYDRSVIRLFSINKFPTYSVEVDFSNPQAQTNTFAELTEQVEKECPVARYFGISGVGEGIVWQSSYKGQNLRFKVKGEKHSVSKVKKLVKVDVEKLNSINEFVDYAITENRMLQGVEQVFTINNKIPDIKEMGAIIKWVMGDVNKEESDTLKENGLTMKCVTKHAVDKIRNWFIGYLDASM